MRLTRGRLFTAERSREFVQYLRLKLKPVPGAEAADRLLAGKVAPPKQLVAIAAEELREHEQFLCCRAGTAPRDAQFVRGSAQGGVRE